MQRLIFTMAFVLVGTLNFACSSSDKKDGETKAVESTPPPTPTPTSAQTTTPATKASVGKVECANGKDARILEVMSKENGCELGYTKQGEMAVVASSQNGTDHCQTKLDKIRGNLEGAGFSCK